MGKEIERKFLLKNDAWRAAARAVPCRQGYLSREKDRTVRVRVMGGKGFLTIKGVAAGLARAEFEYEIPVDDAHAMLDNMAERPLIEKVRHFVRHAGLTWEIDEFSGENAGLVMAEVELDHEDQPISKPDWLGEEVTDDPRYYNANLVKNPYQAWGKKP